MDKKHHVIYVPGILDDSYLQSTWVRLWRLYGVHGHLHEMPWRGKEAYEPKFQRLLAKIDQYTDHGHKVSLVGASAGASAVINAYIERRDKISSVAYVCAKINAPETVSDRLYAENPAFKTALHLLQDNLPKLTKADKAKMTSFYSPGDGYVPHAATVIPGVREYQLPSLRHGPAVIYALTVGARKLLHSLKSQDHPRNLK